MAKQQLANAVEQLRDIKPLIEIPDNSIYIYWLLIVGAVIVLILLSYLLFKKIKSYKSINLEKHYLEKLNEIEWSSPKSAAYKATHYGRLLASDERRVEMFSQLVSLLDKYKYKKETDKPDTETLNQFELYKKVCNGSI